ncbi:MAG TPA: hypothetical protein VGR00_00745 [Thermoanaerobaculia bacterium]|jgi:hypothetical protein|nr:hypothetical protein [Thermoanaerobaculia bacterium]
MTKITTVAVAACVAVTLAGFSTQANAKSFKEKESTLTATERVEVPGAVLEPGTYVIKVIELQSNRNVVQVTDVDGAKIYTTCIATPHEGAVPPPNTTFVYYPNATASGAKVLRTWFAPEDRFGQDFVYPKSRAEELARLNKVEVQSYQVAETTPTSEMLIKTPITPIEPEPPTVEKIKEEPVTTAAVEPAPAPQPVAVAENKPRKLPKTASDFPLLLGVGLLALSGAGALRLAGRSM